MKRIFDIKERLTKAIISYGALDETRTISLYNDKDLPILDVEFCLKESSGKKGKLELQNVKYSDITGEFDFSGKLFQRLVERIRNFKYEVPMFESNMRTRFKTELTNWLFDEINTMKRLGGGTDFYEIFTFECDEYISIDIDVEVFEDDGVPSIHADGWQIFTNYSLDRTDVNDYLYELAGWEARLLFEEVAEIMAKEVRYDQPQR
jgi:hypothetical protein